MEHTFTTTEKNRIIGLIMSEIGKLNSKIDKYNNNHIDTSILDNAISDYKTIINKLNTL